MDPILTTLVSAFVLGASKGAAKVGAQSIADAYNALKHVVTTTYGKAIGLVHAISDLELKPNDLGRRQVFAEELQTSDAVNNERLIKLAEAIIDAAEKVGHGQSVGVDWVEVKAARVKIDQIRARANSIGFRAARAEIGEITIGVIDVGGDTGK